MLCRISSRTMLSQPGRAASERCLHTSQTDDESAAPLRCACAVSISVWIGQLPSTTKPARMMASTSVSHASGCLVGEHDDEFSVGGASSRRKANERNIPSS